jgi:hypothetical protein
VKPLNLFFNFASTEMALLSTATSSSTSSACSSLGFDAHASAGPISWRRAVQLCRESSVDPRQLVLQAALDTDVSELSEFMKLPAQERRSPAREREFLVACAAMLVHEKTPLRDHVEAIALPLARDYAAVAASQHAHDSFVALLTADLPQVDVARVASELQVAIRAGWPDPSLEASACRAWFANLTVLLDSIYFAARHLIIPNEASQCRLRGGSEAVAHATAIVEAVTEKLNEDLERISDFTVLQRNPAYLTCLARTLTMSSVIDAATLSETLTSSLNDCFTRCTNAISTLLSHDSGIPVVTALVDDLARGLKARRHVMDNILRYSRDRIAKYAVIALFLHSAKVSKAAGSDLLANAPEELLQDAQRTAPSLTSSSPTLVALACHPEAADVVLALLDFADGYHAVAFAHVLAQEMDALRSCEVPTTAKVADWAVNNSTFASAVIAAHTRLGRDLVVLRSMIEPTTGFKQIIAAIDAASEGGKCPPSHKSSGRICFSFADTGVCTHSAKCSLLHVPGNVVSQLCDHDCCTSHGSAQFREEQLNAVADLKGKAFAIIDTKDHSLRYDISGDRLSFTAGLAVYFNRDYDVGLPIETENLCRQHFRCSCHKPQQCKYIHVCRKLHSAILRGDATNPSATEQSAPAATLPNPAVSSVTPNDDLQPRKPTLQRARMPQPHMPPPPPYVVPMPMPDAGRSNTPSSLGDHRQAPAFFGRGRMRSHHPYGPPLSMSRPGSIGNSLSGSVHQSPQIGAPSGMGPPQLTFTAQLARSPSQASGSSHRPFHTHVEQENAQLAGSSSSNLVLQRPQSSHQMCPPSGAESGRNSAKVHGKVRRAVESGSPVLPVPQSSSQGGPSANADETPERRTHGRQNSDFAASFSDVSESPLALAFSTRRRTFADANGSTTAPSSPAMAPPRS